MRIPPKLHPEIMARHAAGQSDQAIADWLAHLDPPVTVSRIAILQTRQRLGGVKPRSAAPLTSTPSSGKLSGAQGAKVRAVRSAQEAKDHRKRGAVIVSVPAEPNIQRLHIYQLLVLADLQNKLNSDPIMTLPDKIRMGATIAQAMAKLQVQAELEKQIEQLEHERAVEAQVLVSERQNLEIEQKRIEAERREIDEEWAKLRAERAGKSCTP